MNNRVICKKSLKQIDDNKFQLIKKLNEKEKREENVKKYFLVGIFVGYSNAESKLKEETKVVKILKCDVTIPKDSKK